MWVIPFLGFSALLIWGVVAIIKWSNPDTSTSGNPATKVRAPKPKKERKYITVDFKVPKRIKNDDTVQLYAVPDSNKVNLYEDNSYGGEGFLHKEFNKHLWEIVKEKKYTSAKIVKNEKNLAHAEIRYV